MGVRRLADKSVQPKTFVFSDENLEWAQAQIAKFPHGKQASAIIPLLWRAQEQVGGWLPEAAIRYVSELLGLTHIRGLEIATFYTMFQLQPVGSVAHIQVCGTTPCMLCGSEKLMDICKRRIAPEPHRLSADGKFSWEEMECLGACVNAPMALIGKDYYEDLNEERFEALLDALAAGKQVLPGSQAGRFSCESVANEATTLLKCAKTVKYNGTVSLAMGTAGKYPGVLAKEPVRAKKT